MSEARDSLFGEETFLVDTDAKAEWALRKIAEKQEEKARWKAYYKEALAKIVSECDSDIDYLQSLLERYFETVPHRATKTQESYKLASGAGTLIMKFSDIDYEKDEKTIIEWLKENELDGLVKVEESLCWGELKKGLTISGEKAVIKETGEIVPGIKVINRGPKFTIQIKDKNND